MVFYEDEDFLCDVATEFLLGGLKQEERLLIVAREARRIALASSLDRRGFDVESGLLAGRLVILDACELIANATVDGVLQVNRLMRQLEEAVFQVLANDARARVYGEVAGLLCEAGQAEAAEQLEAHWNLLKQRHWFTLLCSFPALHGQRLEPASARLCSLHTITLPSEHCRSLGTIETRLQHLFLLEQHVLGLERELEQATRTEARLQRELNSLNLCHHAARSLLGDCLVAWRADLVETGLRGEPETAERMLSRNVEHTDAIASVVQLLRRSATGEASKA